MLIMGRIEVEVKAMAGKWVHLLHREVVVDRAIEMEIRRLRDAGQRMDKKRVKVNLNRVTGRLITVDIPILAAVAKAEDPV